jgi:oxygen-dependent protoporphyrinogen oxidase
MRNRFRFFLGGALNEEVLRQDDSKLATLAHSQVSELLRVTGEPHLDRVHRYPASMAQYHLGHLEMVAAIEGLVSDYPGLALAGSAYRGVGIADCIYSGEEAAARVLGTP